MQGFTENTSKIFNVVRPLTDLNRNDDHMLVNALAPLIAVWITVIPVFIVFLAFIVESISDSTCQSTVTDIRQLDV